MSNAATLPNSASNTLFILRHLEVRSSELHGWGVFALAPIAAGSTIEECLVLEGLLTEVGPLVRTLRPYLFGGRGTWPKRESVVCLGLGAVYNHSHAPNVRWEHDKKSGRQIMRFIARRDIAAGEELLVTYGPGYWLAREQDLLDALAERRQALAMVRGATEETAAPHSDSGTQAIEAALAAATRERQLAGPWRRPPEAPGLDAVEAYHQRAREAGSFLATRAEHAADRVKKKRSKLAKVQASRAKPLTDVKGAKPTELMHLAQLVHANPQDGDAATRMQFAFRLPHTAISEAGLSFEDEEPSIQEATSGTVAAQADDVLVSIAGANRGDMGQVPRGLGGVVVGGDVLVLRPDPSVVDPTFFWEILRQGPVRRRLEGLFAGLPNADVFLRLPGLEVPVPDRPAQEAVVAAILRNDVRLQPLMQRLQRDILIAEEEARIIGDSQKALRELQDAGIAALGADPISVEAQGNEAPKDPKAN